MGVLIPQPDRPIHLQTAEWIKQLVAREYKPGDVLPDYNALAARFGVGRVTIKKAMSVLRDNGLVTPIRKRGTIVNRRLKPGERSLTQIGLVAVASVGRLFGVDYLSEIAAGIFTSLGGFRADVRIFSFHRWDGGLRPQHVGRAGLDGAILLGIENEQYLEECAALETPMVLVDAVPRRAPLDSVACDNAAASRTVVNHLIGLGHRRIAYLSPIRLTTALPALESGPADPNHGQEQSDSAERREGFLAAIQEAGLADQAIFYPMPPADNPQPGPSGPEALAEAVRHDPSAPTAAVTDDDQTALRLMAQLKGLGIAVPGDLSVAAVAGAKSPEPAAAGLTYCVIRFRQMGEQAVSVLELRCRTPRPAKPEVVRIGFDFVGGTSSGPPAPR